MQYGTLEVVDRTHSDLGVLRRGYKCGMPKYSLTHVVEYYPDLGLCGKLFGILCKNNSGIILLCMGLRTEDFSVHIFDEK